MNPLEETLYIRAYSQVIGLQESDVIAFIEKKGLHSLITNPDSLLETPVQRERHQAFMDLYRMSMLLENDNPSFTSPESMSKYAHSLISQIHKQECVLVFYLDTRLRLVDFEQISQGTLESAITHPRDIFRNAIVNNVSAIALIHNHPSGTLEPSSSDILLTKRVASVGATIGIALVDHIIVGGLDPNKFYSFARETSILSNVQPELFDPSSSDPYTSYQSAPSLEL